MANFVVSRRTVAGPAQRVVATIADDDVWFESDVPLELNSEAVAAAFLLVCAHHGRGLELDAPVAPRFRDNLEPLQQVAREFWQYDEVTVAEPGGRVPSRSGSLAPMYRGAALMFSGGVDSFYSLLRGPVAPQALVFVEGFDIPLSEPQRTGTAWASLQSVAEHLGLRAIKFSTNLREHALFRTVNWEVTHGGALAAVGHLLAPHFSHVVISSSHSYHDGTKPWGSHFRLDSLWSSDSLGILHAGAHIKRSAKLLQIADEPVVQRNLRVCWEGETTQLNCGTCEKCVRTQLVLRSADKLGKFETFATGESGLVSAVRALSHVKNRNTLANTYTRFASAHASTELGREVARLIDRSKRYHLKRSLAKSAVGKAVVRLL